MKRPTVFKGVDQLSFGIQLLVLLVSLDTVERGADQFCGLAELLINLATVERGVDQLSFGIQLLVLLANVPTFKILGSPC